MYSVSQHVHSQHGSGAVNLVDSRKPGKRKRGRRSAAAIAARIERVLEASTHNGWHRVRPEQPCRLQRNGEQMAAAIKQLNARLQKQDTVKTTFISERESLARQVQNLSATTSTPGQRVRVGAVDTRVIGKQDQFDGDPMKNADWSFKLRSYLGAVDHR